MAPRRSLSLLDALAQVAPGKALREGVDRILQAGMGGLIVVGDGPEVLNICSGGFLLDAAYSPQRLSELAKMDGATILAADASRIARANVHLVPNPSVATSETGTRHRTAERVARSINVPVLTISQRMNLISVYVGDEKHQIESIPRVVNRANQALQTLERYRSRLDADSSSLATLEIEDFVTVRDVVNVLQRAEGVERIAEEIEGYIVELGVEGRLVRLQLVELLGGLELDRLRVVRDYVNEAAGHSLVETLDALSSLSTEELIDPAAITRALGLTGSAAAADAALEPRGYRLLSRIPRLPDAVIDQIVEHFGSLQKIMRATIADLDAVEGVGRVRAVAIKDGLGRLAESSILDRYS
ncbi:MAG TPA: DNA integrity scanning diadenylate cyclase DisA [Acidimicrobiales bacterium]